MNEPCKNVGCNQQRDGRCTGMACGGADSSDSSPPVCSALITDDGLRRNLDPMDAVRAIEQNKDICGERSESAEWSG